MKAYIENQNGRWLINGKRSNQWNFIENQLMNDFFKIIKRGDQKDNSVAVEKPGCNPFTYVLRFFKTEKLKHQTFRIDKNGKHITVTELLKK